MVGSVERLSDRAQCNQISDAMLVIIAVMNFSYLSMSPFVDDWNISQMSVSKYSQSHLLFAGGHFIFFCDTITWVKGTVAWSDCTLWYDFWPWT